MADDLNLENRGCVLVASSSEKNIAHLEKNLLKLGFSTQLATGGEQALELFKSNKISYVLIDIELEDMACHELVHSIRVHINVIFDDSDRFIPIIILATTENEEQLFSCVSAGSDDFLFKPFTSIAINSRIASLDQMCELKQLYKSSINEQILAKRILTNALEERSIQFEEIGLLSQSAAIFSGDLFLTERHQDGHLNVLIADFTGHGLSAAIGALPVADVFSAMTKKGFESGYIIENINNKLHTLLPVGMFMACSMLSISSDLKHVKIWNGGMPDIYLREHGTGRIKHKIGSTHIPLGISEVLVNQDELKIIDVDLELGDQLILFTDGLTDAMNSDGDMFGEDRLNQCLQKHGEDEFVFSAIVEAFNKFCGNTELIDDVTLACIPCTGKLMHTGDIKLSEKTKITSDHHDGWCWYMELVGLNLRETNPVPIVIDEIYKIFGHSVRDEKLSDIMTSLYENVIEYGAPEDYINETDLSEYITNNYRNVDDIYIRIGLKKIEHNNVPALLVRMEDSGKNFAHDQLMNCLNNKDTPKDDPFNKVVPLTYEFNEFSNYDGYGNRLEVILYERI